jgi:tRNA (guanine-N7-)-methyltransferase
MTASTRASTRSRHRMHGNPFNIRGPVDVPDWTVHFGRSAPFAVDIGFAQGAFLLELARRHPEWNVVGLEIRRHFVDEANAQAALEGLQNVHAVLANANVHLDQLVPPASVAFVSVNFPDPWYKTRHHKRRVVRPEWATVLATRMAAGGELHAMTDYEPVAREILAVMEATPGFRNLDGEGSLAAESTTGIESERERTHKKRGEPIYRVRFRFVGA